MPTPDEPPWVELTCGDRTLRVGMKLLERAYLKGNRWYSAYVMDLGEYEQQMRTLEVPSVAWDFIHEVITFCSVDSVREGDLRGEEDEEPTDYTVDLSWKVCGGEVSPGEVSP